jgi:hypothetical protein
VAAFGEFEVFETSEFSTPFFGKKKKGKKKRKCTEGSRNVPFLICAP